MLAKSLNLAAQGGLGSIVGVVRLQSPLSPSLSHWMTLNKLAILSEPQISHL